MFLWLKDSDLGWKCTMYNSSWVAGSTAGGIYLCKIVGLCTGFEMNKPVFLKQIRIEKKTDLNQNGIKNSVLKPVLKIKNWFEILTTVFIFKGF